MERLKRARALLRRYGCTHILVSDTVDVRYICGFRSSNAYLLISRNQSLLLTDFRYQQTAERFCARTGIWKLVLLGESMYSSFAEHIPPGSALGIQSESMTVDSLDRLKRKLRRVKTIKLGGAVSALSEPKTDTEISHMRRAASIGSRALKQTLAELRRGITEKEVATILEAHCRELGSEGPSFDTIVLFGTRSALPHGTPSNARLKNGDWILFDFGCTVKGFCSDMTRTVIAGTPSTRQREIYNTVRTAQRHARTNVRAGLKGSTVDALARETIDKAGFGEYFGHATGHGVGLRIHEGPRLSRTNTARLPQRAVVTVEPGIYIPRVGGVRIEDMVALRSRDSRLLTHFPRHLIEIDL